MSEQPPWLISSNPDTKEVTLVSTNGFQILLSHDLTVLDLLNLCSKREVEFKDLYDQRLRFLEDGMIMVIEADPWVNQGWKYGSILCHASDLAQGIAIYFEVKWLRK